MHKKCYFNVMSNIENGPEVEFVGCPSPGCEQLAEVLWSTHLQSTDGAMRHVKIQCVARHLFLMPADMVP